MRYLDVTKYSETTQKLVEKLSEHQGQWDGDVRLPQEYMTDDEKKEFIENMKKFLDLEEVPFVDKMLAVSDFCGYSREVHDFLFGHK